MHTSSSSSTRSKLPPKGSATTSNSRDSQKKYGPYLPKGDRELAKYLLRDGIPAERYFVEEGLFQKMDKSDIE